MCDLATNKISQTSSKTGRISDATFTLYFRLCCPSPQKEFFPSQGGAGPHIIRGTLSPPDPTTQTASLLSQLFLQNTRLLPTDRMTDRPIDRTNGERDLY